MSDNEDAFEKADREKREFTDHAIEQIAKTQNVTPFMFTRGTSYDDAIAQLASSLARVERTLSRNPSTYDSRDLTITDLIQRVDRQSRRLDSLELDIAALRSAQQPADPTGAHPYRSATQATTAAPSSPVATSEAAPTSSSASGAWRRVYGALASEWPALVAAAGFSCASIAAFNQTPVASGALAGIAGVALVRAGVWGLVR